MDVERVLGRYDLDRETVKRYVEAITYLNQTEAAEEIGVSRQTIHRLKKTFQKMKPQERTLLIASLLQEKLLEEKQ